MTAAEREFELPGVRLAAREWGAAGAPPILALHGWLDNAGTFDLLAPRLGGCHMIALDCAGHGLSGDRSPDSAYNIWQDVGDVAAVADELGWEGFTLLGHSRGAAIAALYAGTFPARVRALTLIEGGVPVLGRAEDAPEILARALTETALLRAKTGRVFPTRDIAIAERADGFSKTSLAAAEILARRSLLPVPEGYRWRADQRLKATSEVRLTAGQVAAFFARIAAPVTVFLAEESPFTHETWFLELFESVADLTLERLPGGHHLHLEGAEARIAAAVRHSLGI